MIDTFLSRRFRFLFLIVLLALALPTAIALAAPGSPDASVVFDGVVQQKPATIVGPWQIEGRTVVVAPNTQFVPNAQAINQGDRVHVVANRRQDQLVAQLIAKIERPQFMVQGRIDALAAGQWTIGGQVVLIDSDTVIEGDHPDVGDMAMARVERTAAGLLAKRIQVHDPPPPPPVVVRGRIEAIATDKWTIDGRELLINSETVIEGDHPDVGDLAAAVAVRTDAGLLAKHIEVHDAPPPPPPQAVQGRIDAIAADRWTIAGQVVLIDANTVIEGDHPDVGDMAVARVERTNAGLLAKRIRVLDPPAPPLHVIRGKIESMAANKWVIDGQEVLIDAETRIEGDHPDIDDFATAHVQRTESGLLAKHIQVRDEAPGHLVVFRGVVTAIAEESWKVLVNEHEKTVLIDEQTRIIGNPSVGDRVGVKGMEMADGSVLAQMIVKLDDEHEEAPFMGFVTEILPTPQAEPSEWAWVITLPARQDEPARSWTVIVSRDTRINVDPATVQVGAWVKGAGDKLDDQTIQAKMARVTPPPRLPFRGEVTERPDAGAPDFPQGKWVIGGTTVYVSANTRLQGEPPAVGAQAGGFGDLRPDGALNALVLMGR